MSKKATMGLGNRFTTTKSENIMAHAYAPRGSVPSSYVSSAFFLFLAFILISVGLVMFFDMPAQPQSSAVTDLSDGDYVNTADSPPVIDAKPEAA